MMEWSEQISRFFTICGCTSLSLALYCVSETCLHTRQKRRCEGDREFVERRVVLNIVEGIDGTRPSFRPASNWIIRSVTPRIAKYDSVASVASADTVSMASHHGVALA